TRSTLFSYTTLFRSPLESTRLTVLAKRPVLESGAGSIVQRVILYTLLIIIILLILFLIVLINKYNKNPLDYKGIFKFILLFFNRSEEHTSELQSREN